MDGVATATAAIAFNIATTAVVAVAAYAWCDYDDDVKSSFSMRNRNKSKSVRKISRKSGMKTNEFLRSTLEHSLFISSFNEISILIEVGLFISS